MPRMDLNKSMMSNLVAMSEGNPGGAMILAQIAQASPFGMIQIMQLDEMEIYGSDIWVLYKDCCGENIGQVEGVIKRHVLGTLTTSEIKEAIRTSKSLVEEV